MRKLFYSLCICVAGLFSAWEGSACTSVIFSARSSGTGRPVMLKHRDTGHLENRIERFQGPKYGFIGLTNSDRDQGKSEAHTSFEGVEVWSGVNDAGFCIMNTATFHSFHGFVSRLIPPFTLTSATVCITAESMA